MQTIEAAELKARLKSGAELALVDVREETDFYTGHLLFAANLPLSRLEQLMDDLIPGAPRPSLSAMPAGGWRNAPRKSWNGSDIPKLRS